MVGISRAEYETKTANPAAPPSGYEILYPFDDGSTTGRQWRVRDASEVITAILKHNYAGTAAPGTGDDVGDGYAIGSIWVDTTNGNAYICESNASGAAVWLQINSTSGILDKLDATAAPTVNDDTDLGYSVGSLWVDVTNDNAYQCVDNTDGAAVWLPIGGTATIIGHTIESSMDSTADYMSFYDIGAGALKAILGQNLPGNITQELLGTYLVPSNIDTTSTSYVDIDTTNIAQSVTLSGSERIEAQFYIARVQQVTGGTGSYKLVADSTDPDTLVEYTHQQTNPNPGLMMFATWSGLGAGTYVIKPQFKTSANTARVNALSMVSWRVVVIQ